MTDAEIKAKKLKFPQCDAHGELLLPRALTLTAFQARQTMEESIKAGGDAYGYVLEKYGDILYQSGEVDKAVKHWKLALEKGPGSRWLERKIAEQKLIEAQ